MTLQVLNRLMTMQPDELRFRVRCEARKLEGRVRTRAFTPAWRRSSLRSVIRPRAAGDEWEGIRGALDRADFDAAHVGLARYFSARPSAFPLNSRDLPALSAAIAARFRSAREHAVARGETLVAGRYDLLGYHGLELGPDPDWHRDAVHGRRSPVVYWADVKYLDPAGGDHKIIWELNRHQHWLTLGRAYTLSQDRRFYRAFVSQLQSWLAANPPLIGTNWASMLELAFRALTWLWALEMFAGAAGQEHEEPWIVDLLLALDRQLTHIEQNLSHYFSPNTHLSGEALALYVAGCALPELEASGRRIALGRDVLVHQASCQVHEDGGHAELSAHYQRYSTDFYLLATSVARRAGDDAAAIFEEAVLAQARFLRAICDNAGNRPQLGDDDGGQLFPICGRPSYDCRPTLAAAAVLLEDPALGPGEIPEETFWLCGGHAAANAPARSTPLTSVALAASGYYVSRTAGGDHLVFDAGRHGFLNCGHAHADALAVTLSVAGRPLLIDPGTATYTMDPALRDRFRSTSMHNTVTLDGRSQSEPGGPFNWLSQTLAEASVWRTGSDGDYVEGTHQAYVPHRHTRAVLSIRGVGWWILDHILGPPIPRRFDVWWHFHPAWQASRSNPHLCQLTQRGLTLALASTAPLMVLGPGETPLAFHSPDYGSVVPAPVARASLDVTAPATVATFIPATSQIAGGLTIETVPTAHRPDGWHTSAYRVRWDRGAMLLLAAMESTGQAGSPDAAPPGRWGTAEVQTNARAALVLEESSGRSEALLINGSLLQAGPTFPTLTLPPGSATVRFTRLASRVHEV